MTDSNAERRRDLRVTFRATARLKFSEAQIFDNCQTSDISISGVFVEGVTGVAAGDKCGLDFHLVGRSSSLVLGMTGEVVRVREQGVALQFAEVDEDSFCHLQNIVYFNYRQEGQLGGVSGESGIEVKDESLYLGLAGGQGKPLPDNYPGRRRDDDDYSGYGDELDRDILAQLGSPEDEDDY